MKKMFLVACAAIGLTIVVNIQLKASDPVGVYGVIEKVVFEPTDKAPQRIQVWGAFSVSEGKPGDFYSPAQRGYLYFTLPSGKEDIARREWADLKSVAGTGQGIAFGMKYNMKVRLRKSDEKVEAPDVYPIANGVSKVNTAPIQALKEALRKSH